MIQRIALAGLVAAMAGCSGGEDNGPARCDLFCVAPGFECREVVSSETGVVGPTCCDPAVAETLGFSEACGGGTFAAGSECGTDGDCNDGRVCVFDVSPGATSECHAVCSSDDDCDGGLCIERPSSSAVCFGNCAADDDCNDGWTCAEIIDADTGDPRGNVCIPSS